MPSPSNSDSKVQQGFCFGFWLVFSVCVVWGVFKGEKNELQITELSKLTIFYD